MYLPYRLRRRRDADYIVFKIRRPNRDYSRALAAVSLTIHQEFGPGEFENRKDGSLTFVPED